MYVSHKIVAGSWFISKDTAEEDADKVYIPAFHAYFVTNDGSEPAGIGTQYYGWIDTAIDSYELENADGTSVWFDLSGRRLEGKPSKKGIYIQNGKKVTFEYWDIKKRIPHLAESFFCRDTRARTGDLCNVTAAL